MKRLGLAAALCLLCGKGVMAQDAIPQQSQEQTDAEQRATPAAQAGAEAPPATAEQDEDSQRMVCRTQPVTGSLTRRNRICATAAEWQSLERRSGQQVSSMQRGASGGMVPEE